MKHGRIKRIELCPDGKIWHGECISTRSDLTPDQHLARVVEYHDDFQQAREIEAMSAYTCGWVA